MYASFCGGAFAVLHGYGTGSWRHGATRAGAGVRRVTARLFHLAGNGGGMYADRHGMVSLYGNGQITNNITGNSAGGSAIYSELSSTITVGGGTEAHNGLVFAHGDQLLVSAALTDEARIVIDALLYGDGSYAIKPGDVVVRGDGYTLTSADAEHIEISANNGRLKLEPKGNTLVVASWVDIPQTGDNNSAARWAALGAGAFMWRKRRFARA